MVVGAQSTGCQVAVIGGGPAGYVAAARLGQLGKDVLLIEEAPTLGGVCLNEGCIPSKALIHAAEVFVSCRHAATMGIHVDGLRLDMPQLIAWKQGIVDRLTRGVRYLVTAAGSDILRGRATFLSDRQLSVVTESGTHLVTFEQAVIATGTHAIDLPNLPVDGETLLGSREVLALEEIPATVAVVGGGYIGLELGTVLAKLGARVTVVEMLPQIFPGIEPEIRRVLLKRLDALGIDVRTEARALRHASGRLHIDRAGEEEFVEADKVVVSVGRRPNTTGMGLEAIGVEVDERGFVRVDEAQRTSVVGIYAVGDVAGGPQLAHKAYREAKVAAEVIAGQPAAFDNQVVPAVVFTDPEIAWVGLTEAAARAQGLEVKTGTFPLSASGRALTLDAPGGLVKVVAEAPSGRLLGVHLCGPGVGELVGEAALAIEMDAFLDDLALTIHPHPTLSEGLMEAAEIALGRGTHAH